MLVKVLLLRLLAAFAVMLIATSNAVPTSAAIAGSTPLDSPSLTAWSLEARDHDLAVRPVRLLIGLLDLNEGAFRSFRE